MKILVTGGAGYIGSHIIRELEREGNEIIVYDNIAKGKGHIDAIKKDFLRIGNLADKARLNYVFEENNIESVIHLASNSSVEESVKEPLKYYRDVSNGINLLECMEKHKVRNIVFSSTAAVYGNPKENPITETHPINPINPYGESKAMFENILRSYGINKKLTYTILRYFNAAGADLSAEIGEDHYPETHLIPRILKKIINGEAISIFGTDYSTPDGTCIRDYIHVGDIAQAHIIALKAQDIQKGGRIYNLGSGKGYSVREIIRTARDITGKEINIKEENRRERDPEILIASPEKIKRELGWEPQHDIKKIILSAWKWHTKNPDGYSK